MATAAYWQRGEALDYTNSDETTIPVNTIVAIGSRIGITGAPIAPSETGVLHVGGVCPRGHVWNVFVRPASS